jgi:hypothetical protein
MQQCFVFNLSADFYRSFQQKWNRYCIVTIRIDRSMVLYKDKNEPQPADQPETLAWIWLV